MQKSVNVSLICGSDVLQHIISTKVSNLVYSKDVSVFKDAACDSKKTKPKATETGDCMDGEASDTSESSLEDDSSVPQGTSRITCRKLHSRKTDGSSKQQNKSQSEIILNEAKSYFEARSKVTSNRQLSRISGQMNYEQLRSALNQFTYVHSHELDLLKAEYQHLFHTWMYQLSKGMNLLLYGVGSKYHLLDQFVKTAMKNCCHIVVNGYFPDVNIKSILNAITEEVFGCKDSFQNHFDQCELIQRFCCQGDYCKGIVLVIHNIDGPSLQSRKTQMVLSRLARIEGIHIIASADHVNGSLLWDQVTLSQFNWVHFDTTTYDFYENETSFENSMLVQHTASLQLSSLLHVLNSLTQNAQSIFRILAEYQLLNGASSAYTGLSFPDLYQKCRESFLVSSDLTLHAQLTEFHDHKLIRIKKGIDGIEYLTIPLEKSALSDFHEQQYEERH